MIEARPSATAWRVALRRAAHQLADAPRVFDDPIALQILGTEAVAKIKDSLHDLRDQISKPLRAFFAVRSRYAEDQLKLAVDRGVTQYVILGAGLDTFAYRNIYPPSTLHIFEVDHPATQAWKKDLIAAAGISIPTTVTFAPVDFEKGGLSDALFSCGFSLNRMTFFSWLGVVPYLTEEAMMNTFRFVRAMPPGSGVVFDFAVPRETLDFMGRLIFDALASRVAAAGEPFQLFFRPEELKEKLKQLGFQYFEDMGADELKERYFKDRQDGLKIRGELARLMAAYL